MALLTPLIQGEMKTILEASAQSAPSEGILSVVLSVIASIIGLLAAQLILPPVYYILLESGPGQATVGKRLMGLYVVNQDGARCSAGDAAIRYFARTLLPFLVITATACLVVIGIFVDGSKVGPILVLVSGVIGYAVVGWKIYISYLYSPTRQGLHDKIAHCFVVTREHHPSYGMVAIFFVAALFVSAIIQMIVGYAGHKRHYSGSSRSYSEETRSERMDSDAPSETPSAPPPQTKTPPEAAPNTLDASAPILPEFIAEPTSTTVPTPQPSHFAPKENLVSFGSASRGLSSSVAFMNPSRTELRVFLGQRDFTTDQIGSLQAYQPGDDLPPGRPDMLLVATFSTPVDADCSITKASGLTVYLFRTGLTGFPLPGRSPFLRGKPLMDSAAGKLTCGTSHGNGASDQIALGGTLIGEAVYSQGEAAWPVSWNVEVGG